MQQDLGEFSSQNFTHFASKVRMFIVVGLLYIIHMTPFPSQFRIVHALIVLYCFLQYP